LEKPHYRNIGPEQIGANVVDLIMDLIILPNNKIRYPLITSELHFLRSNPAPHWG
jgi:hypothetical protein